VDQTRSREYLEDVITYLQKQVDTGSFFGKREKKVSRPAYSAVKLVQVALSSLVTKSTLLNDLGVLSTSDLEQLISILKKIMVSDFETVLTGSADWSKKEFALFLSCLLEALEDFKAGRADVEKLSGDAQSCASTLKDIRPDLSIRLMTFIAAASADTSAILPNGDVSSDLGRSSIQKTITAVAGNADVSKKLEIISSLMPDDDVQLDKLLAIRHVIAACEG
jgi:hypothetical protein